MTSSNINTHQGRKKISQHFFEFPIEIIKKLRVKLGVITIKFGQEITAIVVAKSPNDEPGIDRSEFEDIRQYLRDRRNIKRTTKSL